MKKKEADTKLLLRKYNPYKPLVSGFYDEQKLRNSMGNRIVANYRLRLGIATSTSEDQLDKEGREILERHRKAYRHMAEAAVDSISIKTFKGNDVISDMAEFAMAEMYEYLAQEEERMLKYIKAIIHKHPLWKAFLKDVNGVGELMALVLIGCIDIEKARTPSSLWKYCGLDVAEDGKGRSRRKEHLVLSEYVNKNGETDVKLGLSYKAFLHDKLLGVLGPSFIKGQMFHDKETKELRFRESSKYARIYVDYKHRLENHPKYCDGGEGHVYLKSGKKSPPTLHRHQMAVRYMVKMFLLDLYLAWRSLEGLPITDPYHEAKLGRVHAA